MERTTNVAGEAVPVHSNGRAVVDEVRRDSEGREWLAKVGQTDIAELVSGDASSSARRFDGVRFTGDTAIAHVARAIVARTRTEQALPATVTDPAVLARLATLITAVEQGVRREAEDERRGSG